VKKNLILLYFLSIIFFATLNAHAEDPKDQYYRLGSGDKLQITVFNHEDLTGEYTVDGTGNVSIPLIGTITAKNLSLSEFEETLRSKLSPDYIVNPKFSIQVLNYRPFYILGEVERPDSYSYVSGMTYLTAVAIAGGFTYRAKQNHVFVIHANDATKTEVQAKMDMPVMPGDIIRVDERMF
jgi:protein involved in polysaccharide export with SLBB domain